MLSGGEISGRTIVFAAAQKAIYKGGLQYGISDLGDLKTQIMELLGDTNIIDKLEELIHDYYTTELIDNSQVTTKIEQLIEQYYIDNPQDLPKSSKSAYGVVKIGDGINVSNGVISVTLTKGDKGDPGEKGEKGDRGEKGEPGSSVAYDDRALQEQIDALDQAIDEANETAAEEYGKLQTLIDTLDDEITDRFEEMLEDTTWMTLHWPAGQQGSTSNFGQQDVEEYLQMIGVWDENEAHTLANAKWSKLVQRVSSLEGTVNTIQTNGIDQEALQAAIQLKIEEEVASLDLSTIYARKKAEEVIEWLYSGLKGQTNSTMTFADIVSAGKSQLHSAIADLHTYVEKLKNGDYVASASIEAAVDQALAGLKVSAGSNTAKTEIFNKINQNSTDIAAIVSSITNDSSNTTIANKIGNWRAGVITTATLDSAIATLLATNGSYTSGIMTETEFNTAKASLVAASDYNAASIVAMVNNAGSNVTISADKINLNGTTFVDTILTQIATLNGVVFGQDYITVLDHAQVGAGIHSTISTTGVTVEYVNANNSTSGSCTLSYDGITISSSGDSASITATGTSICTSNDLEVGDDLYVAGEITWGQDNTTLGAWFDAVQAILNEGDLITDSVETKSIKINDFNGANDSCTITYESSPDGLLTFSTGFDAGSNSCINGSLSVTGIIYHGGLQQNSDERIKDNIVELNTNIDDIAGARIATFNFKGEEEKHLGSIAQDWQTIFPEAVKEHDGILTLDYNGISIASAVTAAREIVELKKKNEELEARLAALEEKLGL